MNVDTKSFVDSSDSEVLPPLTDLLSTLLDRSISIVRSSESKRKTPSWLCFLDPSENRWHLGWCLDGKAQGGGKERPRYNREVYRSYKWASTNITSGWKLVSGEAPNVKEAQKAWHYEILSSRLLRPIGRCVVVGRPMVGESSRLATLSCSPAEIFQKRQAKHSVALLAEVPEIIEVGSGWRIPIDRVLLVGPHGCDLARVNRCNGTQIILQIKEHGVSMKGELGDSIKAKLYLGDIEISVADALKLHIGQQIEFEIPEKLLVKVEVGGNEWAEGSLCVNGGKASLEITATWNPYIKTKELLERIKTPIEQQLQNV